MNFSPFFPIFVFCCFNHPAVVVHEVESCLFLRFLRFYKFVEIIFPSSFGSPYLSSCCGASVEARCASRKSFWSTFFQEGKQFWLPFATSVFCVFQSSMEPSVSPCVLRPPWCFIWCLRSNLPRFQWRLFLHRLPSGKIRRCPGLCLSFVLSPFRFLCRSYLHYLITPSYRCPHLFCWL